MASLNECSNPIIKNPVKATNVQSNKALYKGDSNTALLDPRSAIKVKSIYPKKRQEVVKWYGWGYNDSGFHIKDNEVLYFKGKQYALDDCILPNFTDWVVKTFSLDIRNVLPTPTLPKVYPEPTNNIPFVEDIKNSNISYSQEGLDRYIRCHGQTLHEIYYICNNRFKRIPDMVTWPLSHDEVKRLVMMAHKYNVVLIPYGGGTSVSGAITCPQREKRMICVVDTSQMNRLLWLNKENLTACFEAGIVGQDLERALKEQGLTLGHEPDSIELSTLGGWVATRASGMKKNVYGNIEDLVISVKLVTARGDVLERISNAPRISCGPDFNHIVLGSEGTLGIITEVVVKLRPIPKVKRYGSYVFPDFESGVEFMHEVAHRRCQPASVRLMDNEQFKMGQNLKPVKSSLGHFVDSLKKTYLTTFKRLDLNKICAATLLFEGEEKQVEQQAAVIHEIAKQFKGISGGAENGERGYILTFIIGYLRDIGIRVGIIGESFETSVPWDRCSTLCHNVKKCIENECLTRGIRHFITSCRVTQTYDVGACVYFYFSFRSADIPNPLETFEAIEVAARNEILFSGGSISHHHGVGKLRNQWYTSTVTEAGVALYKAAKRQLDPKNIFAVGNLLPEEDTTQKQQQQQQHHVQAKL